jgi:hypothetical protein
VPLTVFFVAFLSLRSSDAWEKVTKTCLPMRAPQAVKGHFFKGIFRFSEKENLKPWSKA